MTPEPKGLTVKYLLPIIAIIVIVFSVPIYLVVTGKDQPSAWKTCRPICHPYDVWSFTDEQCVCDKTREFRARDGN